MKKFIAFGVLVLCLALVSADKISEFSNIIDSINSNENYLQFISDSKYHSVEVAVGNESYYFVYENNLVKMSEETDCDIKVKITPEEFEDAIDNLGNTGKLKDLVIKKIPLGVKISIFFQCLGTDWCRKKIFG